MIGRLRGLGPRGRVIAMVAASTAAVVLGLTIIDIVVLRTIQPQLADLRIIGEEHAAAVSAATTIAERLSELRRHINATVLESVPVFDANPSFASVEAALADLRRLSNEEPERDALRRVDAALDRARRIARQVEQELSAGDRARAVRSLEEFADAAASASESAGEIAQFNARQVRDLSTRVHRALSRAMVATSVLAVIIVIAALLLLVAAARSFHARSLFLERHADEMGAFAARAAHELRSPLQALSLSLAGIRRGADPSQLLGRAEASVERLSATLHDILEFSRTTGQVEEGARSDIATVLREVREELAPHAEVERVEIAVDAESGLHVAMASGHLGTVLTNLVGNAIKYGSHPGHVRVRVRRMGERVDVSVSDDGPGITASAVDHIFEPFYRASTRRDGYGLGLATVKRLVEAHGGTITVATGPTSGTTFHVDLPAAAPQSQPSAVASRS